MLIINKSARLIDFNFDKVKYRLMPAGSPVEVPQKAMDSTFLKTLISEGSIETTTGSHAQAKEQFKEPAKVVEDTPVSVKTKKGK